MCFFEAEKLTESWVTHLDLLARCPAVVGQIIAAAESDREVNQAAKHALRCLQAGSGMLDTKIEDDARPRLARPRKEALRIPLNQPYGAVDHWDRAATKQVRSFIHECAERRARNIDLRNHLAVLMRRAKETINLLVVTIEVSA